jgi:hypothetical protein
MSYRELAAVASAARIVSSESAVIDTLQGFVDGTIAPGARFALNVTAASGNTPTLDVKIVGVIGDVDFDMTPAFTQKVTTGKQVIEITSCPRYIKVVWTIGAVATPSFTFTVAMTRG